MKSITNFILLLIASCFGESLTAQQVTTIDDSELEEVTVESL